MNEEFERIMSIASDGRFDEARKAIQEMDISETEKARFNMMLWQMETKRFCPPSQPDIPKIPVISMILGFVFICTAFFLEGNVQTGLIVTGLVMAGVIPTIYCLREKVQNDKLFDKRDEMSSMYSAEGADMNFPWRMPSPSVIITMVIGILFLIIAMCCYDNADDDFLVIASLILIAAGCTLLTVSRMLAQSFNGTFMWAAISVSSLFLAIGMGTVLLFPDNIIAAAVFIGISGLILLLYPLEYRVICKACCSEQVKAECIDIQTIMGHRNWKPKYRAIWKYEYNGVTYIHRDMSTYKSPYIGKKQNIGISPKSPHNIYTGKVPTSSLLFFAAGFFILMFFLIFLIHLE